MNQRYCGFFLTVLTATLGEKSFDSSVCQKSDENSGKKPPQRNWRKIFRTMRDVGSIASVLLSLIKILQELGLIP